MTTRIAPAVDSVSTDIAAQLRGVSRLGVAYSGGIDSTVLLALSVLVLGADNVVGVLAVSPSLANAEREAAHTVAETIGARVVEITTHELDLAEYRINGVDRCYFCKDELFATIDDAVRDELGLDAIAYGENADDVKRIDRPGARAATEHGVLRPLAAAGLSKADVRAVARELGLPNADKPASPCLASRIPHHEPVTRGKLLQIETAESAMHALGFADLRVRHHGAAARVEIALPDLPRALAQPLHGRILSAVAACGFDSVTIDPRGLRSGEFTLTLLQRGAP